MASDDWQSAPRPSRYRSSPFGWINNPRQVKLFKFALPQIRADRFAYLRALGHPGHVRGEDSARILQTIVDEIPDITAVLFRWSLVGQDEHLSALDATWLIGGELQNWRVT